MHCSYWFDVNDSKFMIPCQWTIVIDMQLMVRCYTRLYQPLARYAVASAPALLPPGSTSGSGTHSIPFSSSIAYGLPSVILRSFVALSIFSSSAELTGGNVGAKCLSFTIVRCCADDDDGDADDGDADDADADAGSCMRCRGAGWWRDESGEDEREQA